MNTTAAWLDTHYHNNIAPWQLRNPNLNITSIAETNQVSQTEELMKNVLFRTALGILEPTTLSHFTDPDLLLMNPGIIRRPRMAIRLQEELFPPYQIDSHNRQNVARIAMNVPANGLGLEELQMRLQYGEQPQPRSFLESLWQHNPQVETELRESLSRQAGWNLSQAANGFSWERFPTGKSYLERLRLLV